MEFFDHVYKYYSHEYFKIINNIKIGLVKILLTKRIIPCLDVKDGKVVKGINFINLREVGDPVEMASIYNDMDADELCFLDITATFEGRNAFLDVIRKTAEKVFIPMTVGGGVNKVEDVGNMLRAGADKVAINSGAVKNPEILKEGALSYGTQCIVLAVDAKYTGNTPCGWEVFVKGGREATGIDTLEWIKKGVKLGAGEILLTSMDADGTKAGYDLPLNKLISAEVNVPVIASGGAGKLEHIIDVFEQTQVNAALLASMVHFGEVRIDEIKQKMIEHNISTRYTFEIKK